jgi:ribosomal protein S27E
MNMSKEREYVESKGVRCPYCKSEDIEGGFVETNAGTAQQNIRCNNCGEEWTDSYTLNGVENFVDKIKVVISVSGGVVQGVWANTQNIEVNLFDFDNSPAICGIEGSDKLVTPELIEARRARDKAFNHAIETMSEILF